MIQEVMLAALFTPEEAVFPYLATPKIDGIRFFTYSQHVWARSNKSIPNVAFQHAVPKVLPDGIDGEITVGTFHQTESFCMSDYKTLEDAGVKLYVFDWMVDDRIPYMDRITKLNQLFKALAWKRVSEDGSLIPEFKSPACDFSLCALYPVWIKNFAQLETYYSRCLSEGYEGIILRDPRAAYKFGRSTVKENAMLKYKPTIDREAVILGVEEKLTNTNPSFTNELGKTKRSSAQSGLVPAGTLGSFHVRDVQTGVEFHVGGGPGLTDDIRSRIWQYRDRLGGLIIEYRSMPYGVKEKPRQPQFLRFKEGRVL